MNHGNSHAAVPPGFRFHPTDEELLYYYLRKKVAYEAIDLDVIRDVDLNKLEPWDLKDRCRIGSGPQNEWYFFSHKDKKYPTGTRTNRATSAGFWKATGRDKAIHISNSERIGMRKTLVFYTGRAPNGLKTDWIMHEYRLDNDHSADHLQEEGWVVCRVFKKKNLQKCSNPSDTVTAVSQNHNHLKALAGGIGSFPQTQSHCYSHPPVNSFSFDNTAAINMHLPQLLSSDPPGAVSAFIPQSSINAADLECSHNLIKLTSVCGGGGGAGIFPAEKMAGDWSVLDKLIASGHQNQLDQFFHGKWSSNTVSAAAAPQQFMEMGSSAQRLFPLQYIGCDPHGLLKLCKEG